MSRWGMNHIQISGVAWNKLEDDRDAQEYTWSLTKVMVSLQSGKAAQKLEARDKGRAESEKGRRQGVMDHAVRVYRGEIDPEGNQTTSTGITVRSARTNQELAEEMRHWVTGDHDDHDRIVAEYKDRIRQEYLSNEEAKANVLLEAQTRRARASATLGAEIPRMVAYTAKDMAEKFPRTGKPGAKFIVEASPVSKVFNRYLRDEPVAPEGMLERKPHTNDPQPRGSLNDMIALRKPRLHGSEE